MIRDKFTLSSRGCAFVTYETKEAAQSAINNLNESMMLPNVYAYMYKFNLNWFIITIIYYLLGIESISCKIYTKWRIWK